MSGIARTTVSPSSVRIRRKVVCVAGCCGPKLRVYKKSLSTSSSAIGSSKSRGMIVSLNRKRLTLRPGNQGEVVPLQSAAQRVVLPQRERGKLLGHQDAAQVRVADEHDRVHV